MSVERRMMLLALGAEVVLTPKETAVRKTRMKVRRNGATADSVP